MRTSMRSQSLAWVQISVCPRGAPPKAPKITALRVMVARVQLQRLSRLLRAETARLRAKTVIGAAGEDAGAADVATNPHARLRPTPVRSPSITGLLRDISR